MSSEKIIVIGQAIARKGNIDFCRDKVQEFIKNNSEESGCEMSTMSIDKTNPHIFLVYEIWKDHNAWVKHLQTIHVTEFIENYNDFFENIQFSMYDEVEE